MTADDLFTRCPTCKTVFRTDDHHLSIQSGRVRCGQCRMVFDGRAHLVEVAFDDGDGASDDAPPSAYPSGAEVAAVLAPGSLIGGTGVADGLAGSGVVAGAQAADPAAFDPRAPSGLHDASTDTLPATSSPLAPTPLPVEVSGPRVIAPTTQPEPPPPIDADTNTYTIAAHQSMLAHAPSDSIAYTGVRYPEIAVDEPGLGETLTTLPPAADGPPTVSRDASDWAVDDERKPTISRAYQPPSGPPSGDTVSRFAQPRTASADALERTRSEHVVMPAWKGPVTPPRGRARLGYGVLAFLLLCVLVLHAVFQFRNVLAADFPVTRRHLVNACAHIGCKIEPLRVRDEIAIESHDLQADPAHQGLLILQTTLRNQARHALAFPHLELQLDDNIGKPIVRRVFAPVEYAGGAADFSTGIPANSEWNVKLFLDGSSISAGTYHLYHFYP